MHRLNILSATFDPADRELRIETIVPSRKGYRLRLGERGMDILPDHGHGSPIQTPPEFLLAGGRHPKPIQEALDGFWECLPMTVRENVTGFAWKQLALAQVLSCSPQALDLMASAPLLVWLLADRIGPGFPLEQALCLVRSRQALVLQTILGRPVQGGLSFLRKAVVPVKDRAACQALRTALLCPQVVDGLRHNRRIGLEGLKTILEFPDLLCFRVMREALEDADSTPHRIWLMRMAIRSCLRFREALPEADFMQLVDSCRSLEDLHDRQVRLHDRFNAALNSFRAATAREADMEALLRDRMAQWRAGQPEAPDRQPRARVRPRKRGPSLQQPFPPPPLPGTDWIVPVQSREALRQESQAMHNCVSGRGYVRKVIEGRSYIYSVYYPERCTLEVGITHNGLTLQELKALMNARPRPETRELVMAWLKENRPPRT